MLKVGWRISCADATDEANRASRDKGRGHARGLEWFGMASIYKLLMHNIAPNHPKNDSHEMIDMKRGAEGAGQVEEEGKRGHLEKVDVVSSLMVGWWINRLTSLAWEDRGIPRAL